MDRSSESFLSRAAGVTQGEEDISKKACPPAQPQWGANQGEEGSSESLLVQLISPSQGGASQRACRSPAPESQALQADAGGVDRNKKACPPAQTKWGATPGEGSSNESMLDNLTSPCQDGGSLGTSRAPAPGGDRQEDDKAQAPAEQEEDCRALALRRDFQEASKVPAPGGYCQGANKATAPEPQAQPADTEGVDGNNKACPPAQPQWGATPGDGSSNKSVLDHLISPSQGGGSLGASRACAAAPGGDSQGDDKALAPPEQEEDCQGTTGDLAPGADSQDLPRTLALGENAPEVEECEDYYEISKCVQDTNKSAKSPKVSKIARKSQKERKAEAKSSEKKKVDQENLKSPSHLSRQDKGNAQKIKTDQLLKPTHKKQPYSVEDLCNEEDMSILWPILGVNSRGEKGRDPRCPSAKKCKICSSRCPEDNIKLQCKACLDPLHRRGCNVRDICEAARRNYVGLLTATRKQKVKG